MGLYLFLVFFFVNPYVLKLTSLPLYGDYIQIAWSLIFLWVMIPVSWYRLLVSFGKWYFQLCTFTFLRSREMIHEYIRANSGLLVFANLHNIFILADALLVAFIISCIIFNFALVRMFDQKWTRAWRISSNTVL